MELSIDESCRVCMLSLCELNGIFEEHEGKMLSELITEISGVQIEENDLLSKKICKDCETRALDFSAFRQLCIDSDETVRYNLLLAEGYESAVEGDECISEENVKIEENDDNVMQMEEYFTEVEEDECVTQLDFSAEASQTGYTELFVNEDENTQEEHHIQEAADSEESTEEVKTKVDGSTKIITVSKATAQSTDELTLKMREAHFAKEQQKKHKCPHCDKYFMFPSKVNRHVKALHKSLEEPKKQIKKNHFCNICGKAFVSQFKVRRHMIVHDSELKTGLQKNWTRNCFLCEACNKKFHTQATFDRHMLICQLLQKSVIDRASSHEYFCVICSQGYLSHDDMVDHMKTHSQSTHQCFLCPDVSYPLNDMIRHGRNHAENITYRCCLCDKTYPNGDEIVAHLLRHKEYKPFDCRECGKAFYDRYKLRQHMNTHDPDAPKNFICEVCNRAFAAQDYLNCHIRRKHSDLKPYQCAFCPKSFAFLHDLNLHSSNHTGDKKHICDICDAAFTKAWSLKQHLALHETNSFPNLQCHICDFTASSKSRLQTHTASHAEAESPQNDAIDETPFTFMETVSDGDTYNLVEIQTSY